MEKLGKKFEDNLEIVFSEKRTKNLKDDKVNIKPGSNLL